LKGGVAIFDLRRIGELRRHGNVPDQET
jgi:hypothetical protein